ncbi:MAG: HAMP domain-containing sensor histidine kinase [candidate division Zixibacteria bacterium]
MASKTDNLVISPDRDELAPDREADRWLELFSILIHDLESPIASVKYLLRILEEGKLDFDNPVHQQIISSSKVATERAESILYDILAVARAGKAGIPLTMANLVPETLIKEAIDLGQASALEHRQKITYTNNAGNLAIQTDPKLLKRVLDNLLYNAVRHTPAGGTIAVYTEPGDRSVFIHIKDDGEGLGDINPAALFEKYGQVRLRAEGKHRGVGLGLYFCKLAVTGMGGTIMADDHPKGGAVFSLKLRKAGVSE